MRAAAIHWRGMQPQQSNRLHSVPGRLPPTIGLCQGLAQALSCVAFPRRQSLTQRHAIPGHKVVLKDTRCRHDSVASRRQPEHVRYSRHSHRLCGALWLGGGTKSALRVDTAGAGREVDRCKCGRHLSIRGHGPGGGRRGQGWRQGHTSGGAPVGRTVTGGRDVGRVAQAVRGRAIVVWIAAAAAENVTAIATKQKKRMKTKSYRNWVMSIHPEYAKHTL